jgi:hypothetical protein
MLRIHWVVRGTGTPKDRDEVNKREVSECDGWVCDLDVMDTASKSSVIRKTVVLTRVRPTLLLTCWVWWKWNTSLVDSGTWTPKTSKKWSISRWACKNKSLTNSLCNLPDVLAVADLEASTNFFGFFELENRGGKNEGFTPAFERSHVWRDPKKNLQSLRYLLIFRNASQLFPQTERVLQFETFHCFTDPLLNAVRLYPQRGILK